MKDWPIYIISLANAKSRRKPLEELLNRITQPYNIYDAVDAREGVPERYSYLVDQEKAKAVLGRQLSAPEIGCALSHLFIYKEIAEARLAGAIVFEDDAILSEGDKFRQFMEERVYERHNLIQLSYGAARIWRCGIGQLRETRMLRSERLVYNAGRATAYSISAHGAKYILQHAIPVRCVADWPCDLRPIAPRIILPKLVGCMPDGLNSHLHQERLRVMLVGDENRGLAGARSVRPERLDGGKNPPPPGYPFFQRFFSKTIF